MVSCPNCSKDCGAPGAKKFCPGCGTSLAGASSSSASAAASNACPSCGKELKPNAKFCSGCGSSVGGAAAAGAGGSPPGSPKRRESPPPSPKRSSAVSSTSPSAASAAPAPAASRAPAKVYSAPSATAPGAKIQMKTGTGVHTYCQEEMTASAEHLNNCLSSDPELAYLLPLDTQSTDLCSKVKDGILLSKFMNLITRDTVDERALNKRKGGKEIGTFQMNENINLMLQSAASLGVKITNIGVTDWLNAAPHIILGVVWQLVKIHILKSINLKAHPELVRLLEPGETLDQLMRLPPEQLLLRWFNYHLKRANHAPIANFSGDVKNSEAYTVLLHQLDPHSCDTSALSHNDLGKRAAQVMNNASKLGAHSIIMPSDICSGNSHLNLVFAASIFNACPGLDDVAPAEVQEVKKQVVLEEDCTGDSREERMFRMWINSLGLDGVFIQSLFDDCRDSLVLLKVLDMIDPGLVDWKNRVEMVPNNNFKKITNAAYLLKLCDQIGFSLPGVESSDIVNGNKKLTLAVVWQMMHRHMKKFLNSLKTKKFGGAPLTDEMLVDWANQLVAGAGGGVKMASFSDRTLGDGRFFVELVNAVRPGAIDKSLLGADKLANAKLTISCARKAGAMLFLLSEDLVEVRPKMVMSFVASILALS